MIHLIKQNAEQRTIKSWNRSIENSLYGIVKSNKRRSAGEYYLNQDELKKVIEETFPLAIRNAAYESFEGIYTADQLATMINAEQIKQDALRSILANQLLKEL